MNGLTRRRDDLFTLGFTSAAVATLHVSAAVGHWSESELYGVAFVLMAALQLGLAVGLALGRWPRRTLAVGIAVNLGIAAVYVLSRTVGLPVGPDRTGAEAIGIPDVMSTLDELVLIVLSLRLLRERALAHRHHLLLWALSFVSLIVFTAIAHVA